jgi:uncharacterized protein YkwD
VVVSRRSLLMAFVTGRSLPYERQASAPSPADRITEIEWHVLFLTNQRRMWQKLPQLEASPALADVARGHSRDMLARGFFEHINPDGAGPRDRVQKHGLAFAVLAENIYSTRNGTMDPAELASIMVDGWMNSPGHRRNILARSLKFLGVGVAMSDTRVLATQLFGG